MADALIRFGPAGSPRRTPVACRGVPAIAGHWVRVYPAYRLVGGGHPDFWQWHPPADFGTVPIQWNGVSHAGPMRFSPFCAEAEAGDPCPRKARRDERCRLPKVPGVLTGLRSRPPQRNKAHFVSRAARGTLPLTSEGRDCCVAPGAGLLAQD
ncbi:hypothetical protein NDU88_003957 [Pleurodeles waltl]|uniref:Uncharacterized protein n=1 Tax=Pleurodeles waltl TaxID=8319 RepID=A0AAV7KX21_PLEWA|nr:hypothetical protein NDU88_003957 [Pleurodeles waltl]